MILVVAGSRHYTDAQRIWDRLTEIWDEFPEINCVRTGGAKGPDSIALSWAKRLGLFTEVVLPNWSKHGKAAGPIRNSELLYDADLLVAFWDGVSSGTEDIINKANGKKSNTIVQIIKVPGKEKV
jgi:YspA, cpYpsA-related SLOG family